MPPPRCGTLGGLVDYQIEPEDRTRSIPNPERRALDKEIRRVEQELFSHGLEEVLLSSALEHTVGDLDVA